MTVLQPGDRAPDFTLPRDGGDSLALCDFKGRKLVLYFYPKADTPGCTRESIAFSRLKSAFARTGTDVVGVSADPLKAQGKFRDKHDLKVPLASDETKKMLTAYGVWGEKTLYGRKFMGVRRTTYLIRSDGRVAEVWENVKVDGHAEAVLAAAKAL
jgi:thioredoxin-dependent peroxiredoxin